MFRSLIVTALFVFAGAANSAVLYTYQGQPFTDFQDDFSGLSGMPTAITGSILLDQPIPECVGYCDYSFSSFANSAGPPSGLLDFVFSDGLTTYSLANLAAFPNHTFYLNLSTDSAGVVDYWQLGIASNFPGEFRPFSHWYFSTAKLDPLFGIADSWNSQMSRGAGTSYYCGAEDGSYGCFDSNPHAYSDVPGSWTTSVVPAPPAVWLLGTALAGLGGRRWLRRKLSS